MRKIHILSTFCLILMSTVFCSSQEIIPVVQSGHSGDIMNVEWDPTSRYVASVDINNELVISDIFSGRMFYRMKVPGNSRVQAMNFVDNSNLLLATNTQTFRFDMQTLTMQPDSRQVQSKANDSRLKICGSTLHKGRRSLFAKDAFAFFTCAAISNDAGFVVAGDEKGRIYFCNANLKLLKTTSLHFMNINDIDFSADGKYVAIGSSDRSVSVWTLPNFNFEKRIIPRSFNITAISTHSNDSVVAFGDELGFVHLLKFTTDKVTVESINAHKGKINDVSFAANPNIVATAGADNCAAISDFENKKVLQYFTLQPRTMKAKQMFDIKDMQAKTLNDSKTLFHDENVYAAAISGDGKRIVYSGGKWGTQKPMLKISSIANLKLNGTKEERRHHKNDMGLSSKNNEHIFRQIYFPDKEHFYGLKGTDKYVIRYDVTLTGYHERDKQLQKAVFNANTNRNLLILEKSATPDMTSNYIIKRDASSDDTYTVKGFEIVRHTNGQDIVFEGHRGFITDFEIIKSKKYLISSAEDASVNIWDIDTGERLLSIFVVDLGKLIFITPDNYYMATGDAITGLGFNYTGKIFPAEQFDLRYNRPDFVMRNFGIFDKSITDMYFTAYQKRIHKFGFSEDMLHGSIDLPKIKIDNINDISLQNTSGTTKLKIAMSDDHYRLDRLNVYINDVPIYGTNGLSLKGEASQTVCKEIDLPLSAGANLISVSCLNEHGVESLKEELNIFYNKPTKTKPNLYLVSIAVAEYEQSQYNLRYTINDGRGFVKLFSHDAKNFANVYVDSLYNARCTKENILKVKEHLMQSAVDDYVYVHIAGHGLLDDDLDFYFATNNVDFANPAGNGLRYDDLEGLLDGIPARNKMLLMDACHSGEVDKDDDFAVDTAAGDNSRGVVLFASKNKQKPKTGLRNSFELMKLLFSDLHKGTGAVVISAASGSGYALENEEIENGIFTYCLMDAFKKNKADKNNDKHITISELRNFIFEGVNKLSKGRQQPTSRKVNLVNDFKVK